ncbi:MAG: hypothetical protein ACD_2C00088G0016 [uncultured bacterium (gcode 4)]|uniref:Uncharacterized protein n=1 Tax=uncultured bacterium (gcode 4) TaxID=1234023 RepID=K2FF66_9BACT|nr:MAG: hypothetical protein ACD_2C00088G0016 [uncultured bacterium (gcode 4)]
MKDEIKKVITLDVQWSEDEEFGDEEELIVDLDDAEKEKEDDYMWHRQFTFNPENDWDSDYFYNERYFEE